MKTIHQALNEAIDSAEEKGFFLECSKIARAMDWTLYFSDASGIPSAETLRQLAFSNGIAACCVLTENPERTFINISSGRLLCICDFCPEKGWRMSFAYGVHEIPFR